MSVAVIESIAARLQSVLNAVDGFTAVRRKRIEWNAEVTGNTAGVTAILVEEETPVDEVTEGDLVNVAAFSVYLILIDSDTATSPIATRVNLALADACDALAAEYDVGGWACAGGLAIQRVDPIEDNEAAIAGVQLSLAVTYSTDFADLSAKGVS